MPDIDSEYSKWKTFHGLSTKAAKEQFEIVDRVIDLYNESRRSRQASCYWTAKTNIDAEGDTTTASGGDWMEYWDRQTKMFLRWYQEPSSDEYKSNVKSPATMARILAIMHKIKKFDLKWEVYPESEDDVNAAKIWKLLLDNVYTQSNMKEDITSWVQDTLTHGSAFGRLKYLKYEVETSYPKINKLQGKEKKDTKEGKIVWQEPSKEIRFKGPILETIPIEEIYPDPNARTIHGHTYRARYIIHRKVVHIDDFRNEYKDKPSSMNIDKVKALSHYREHCEDNPFFEVPHDIQKDNSVQLLIFESELYDQYSVIANDILVEHHPMMFHKEVSVHKMDGMEVPHQFYKMGIPDMLRNTQAAEEILINLAYDYIYRTLDNTVLVDDSIYGEYTDAAMRADSKYIPVNTTMDGKPLASKVMQLSMQPIGFDLFKLLDITKQDETIATQIDPSQMNMQMVQRTATATLQQQQLMDTLLNSFLESFKVAMTRVGRQLMLMLMDVLSVSEVKEIANEEEEESYYNIRLEGKKVVETDGALDIVDDADNPYSFFKVTKEHLTTTSDVDVRISPESLDSMSKALRIQKMQEAYAQMMENAVDPDNDAQIEQHPAPLYDAIELAQQYTQELGYSDKLLLKPKHNKKQEILEAKDDVVRIFAGQDVIGVPGRSKEHKLYQSKVLQLVNKKVDELNDMIETDLEEQQATSEEDAMMMQVFGMQSPEPQVDQDLELEFDDWLAIQKSLAYHLEVDNMPPNAAEEAALMGAEESMAGSQEEEMMPPSVPMPQELDMQDVMPGYGGGQMPM